MPPQHPHGRAKIAGIYRYPVKGMTPEPLSSVVLEAGKTIPFDRAWAIENGPSQFDPAQPRHLPKINFVMLMRNEQLAELKATFDEAAQRLTIASANGTDLARGDLNTAGGRATLEAAIDAHVTANRRGPARIVASGDHSFSDVAAKCLHIVSLDSVRALAGKIGAEVNPLRFRPNLIIEGLPAWTEFDLVDKRIRAGNATLEVFRPTERCAATNVDPATGVRDLKIPSFLSRTYGHTDFGVYARVVEGGEASIGGAVGL